MSTLRFRQIHLDFHTSEAIPGVGSEFEPEEFAETLLRARVNSITCFSRCHHGWIYHDTRFPNRHPHLTCDLLTQQIEVCHKHDIRCPIYITVGWDVLAAREHPEWVEIDEQGRRVGSGASPLAPGWLNLDFASPYVDYVLEQTQEVMERYGDEVDGIFFDIIFQQGVHSTWCMREYEKLGMDPADPKCQAALRKLLVDRWKERSSALVRRYNKNCTIFHNAGHIYPDWRDILHTYTHLELESLPSGGWGYAHFPITQRYARGLGLECLGMTGKFAKTWGHFGSYKPQAALAFECFHMLALGGKCSIGDQLPPRGRLDPATYQLIGGVYSEVERKEPWCEGAVPLTDIALFNVEAAGIAEGRVDPAMLGAYRMLQESRHQFDIVDAVTDWSPYRVLILPDKIPCDERLAAKVDDYVERGGRLVLSHRAGTSPDGTHTALECSPGLHLGDLPHHPDYVKLIGPLTNAVPAAEYVMYERGSLLEPRPGAETLAELWVPYFDRTFEHFCSHFHTPCDRRGDAPALLSRGSVLQFAHPIFTLYGRHGVLFYKQMFLAALRLLLPDPLLMGQGPSTLIASTMRQAEHDRTVVHLLHYIPERRTLGEDIIEDVIPLYNLPLSVRHAPPARVYLAPEAVGLPFHCEGSYVSLTVPEIRGHAMVVLEG